MRLVRLDIQPGAGGPSVTVTHWPRVLGMIKQIVWFLSGQNLHKQTVHHDWCSVGRVFVVQSHPFCQQRYPHVHLVVDRHSQSRMVVFGRRWREKRDGEAETSWRPARGGGGVTQPRLPVKLRSWRRDAVACELEGGGIGREREERSVEVGVSVRVVSQSTDSILDAVQRYFSLIVDCSEERARRHFTAVVSGTEGRRERELTCYEAVGQCQSIPRSLGSHLQGGRGAGLPEAGIFSYILVHLS